MPNEYFSDRENGPTARLEESITPKVWKAIAAIVQVLVADGSFGFSFPEVCPDGSAAVGTNLRSWRNSLQGEHPDVQWPFVEDESPPTLAILDLVEFTYANIGKPIQGWMHPFFKHHHLTFDREAGRSDFAQRINRLFARNGIAYELGENGAVIRLAEPVLRTALQSSEFQTGDATLDAMLSAARAKFLNPDPQVRREALKKLWDAWERAKTIEPGGNKKVQSNALLDLAADETGFRALLATEAMALTDIGNGFLIRHAETNQTPIHRDSQVDYLFHRLFSLLQLVLKERSLKGLTRP
jgi:hypothetical protein